MENNKISLEWLQQEIPARVRIWKEIVQNPKEAIGSVYSKKELDFLQIILIGILNMMIYLILGEGVGTAFGMLIGRPIGLFIAGLFLLLMTWIGKGKAEYFQLVNLAAYLSILAVAANLFMKFPVIGGMIGSVAAVYVFVLEMMTLIDHAGADKKRIIIASVIFFAIIVVVMLLLTIAAVLVGHYMLPTLLQY